VSRRHVAVLAKLADACLDYGTRCRYDNAAVFDHRFDLSEVFPWDYFHPSTAGQAVLADVVDSATGKSWSVGPGPRPPEARAMPRQPRRPTSLTEARDWSGERRDPAEECPRGNLNPHHASL
jgi:hypothetical protein